MLISFDTVSFESNGAGPSIGAHPDLTACDGPQLLHGRSKFAAASGRLGRRWLGLLRLFSLLLGGPFGRRTQLRRHRLRQLHL